MWNQILRGVWIEDKYVVRELIRLIDRENVREYLCFTSSHLNILKTNYTKTQFVFIPSIKIITIRIQFKELTIEKSIKISQPCLKGTNYGWSNDSMGK